MREYFEARLGTVEKSINDLQSRKDSLNGQIKLLVKQVEDSEDKLEQHSKNKELYSKCVEVLTIAQSSVRIKTQHGFEAIVTYALQSILGPDYSFELDFGRRGNLQEVNFKIKSKAYNEPHNPMDTSGGGVVDIVSLALRTAILNISRPRVEGPLILDESFKHLSRQYLPAAGTFLNALADRIGRQIIMVSHKNELMRFSDNSIEIK